MICAGSLSAATTDSMVPGGKLFDFDALRVPSVLLNVPKIRH